MPIEMDTSLHGYEMFFKPYQIKALQYLKQLYPDGANSRQVYKAIKQTTDISRTSIINSLNTMVDDGILTYTETTAKGGPHRIYIIKPDAITYLIETILTKLQEECPAETRKAIQSLL